MPGILPDKASVLPLEKCSNGTFIHAWDLDQSYTPAMKVQFNLSPFIICDLQHQNLFLLGKTLEDNWKTASKTSSSEFVTKIALPKATQFVVPTVLGTPLKQWELPNQCKAKQFGGDLVYQR